MTDQITDFTKSRLTQSFEAKGNAGSRLIEELQPVVVVHDLERGAFPPYQRWSWAGFCDAVAAEFPCAILEAGFDAVEETVIVDRIVVSSTTAQIITILIGQGETLNTVQSFTFPVLHDTRRGGLANQLITPSVTVQNGTRPVVPITIPIHRAQLTANTDAVADIGVIFDRKGYPGAPPIAGKPQLVISGNGANTFVRVNIHGRIFPIQS